MLFCTLSLLLVMVRRRQSVSTSQPMERGLSRRSRLAVRLYWWMRSILGSSQARLLMLWSASVLVGLPAGLAKLNPTIGHHVGV